MRKTKPLADRLWAKVNKHGPVPEHRPELGHCWIWTGLGRGGRVRGLAGGPCLATKCRLKLGREQFLRGAPLGARA